MTTTAPSRGGVHVREAVQADLLAVYRIERASFPQPWPFEAFERFLGQSGFLVAECRASDGGDGVAGYVVADTVPNHGRPLGHVKDLAVHPEHRERGLGSELLARALGVLRSKNGSRVKLEVRADNDAAISLYREHGFAHHHTVPRYYEDGTDAHVMLRTLD